MRCAGGPPEVGRCHHHIKKRHFGASRSRLRWISVGQHLVATHVISSHSARSLLTPYKPSSQDEPVGRSYLGPSAVVVTMPDCLARHFGPGLKLGPVAVERLTDGPPQFANSFREFTAHGTLPLAHSGRFCCSSNSGVSRYGIFLIRSTRGLCSRLVSSNGLRYSRSSPHPLRHPTKRSKPYRQQD